MTQLSTLTCPLCNQHQHLKLHIPEKRSGVDLRSKEYACSSMGHGDHNDIFFCHACQHGFLHPFPTPQELSELYANVEDPLYMDEVDGRIQTFSHHLKKLNTIAPVGNLLEIGSYCGTFLHLAKKMGYKVTGIEPSHWGREQAKKEYDLDLISGIFHQELMINHEQLNGHLFDQIVSWDVLEHVEDPSDFLKLAHTHLKADGILMLSTVNIDSWFTKILGKRWPWYMQMHLHYFTKTSLTHLLQKSGFELIDFGTYKHVISARYFGKKLQTLTGIPFSKAMDLPLFSKCFIPFMFGDIVYLTARAKSSSP